MSFVEKAVNKIGSLLSGGADKAAREAASIQSASADKAIEFQKESRDIARGDLQPFRQAGQAQLDPLSKLISDPNEQLSFVQNNPFFKALADDAQSRLFSNQAAKGKVGSGGTALALQNSLLLLGQDLLTQNINQRQVLVNTGANAAAGQATTTQQSGSAISDLVTGQGNALAAGEVGAANARAQGINSAIKGGLGIGQLVLSDRRAKTDIERLGMTDDGLPLYRFHYIWDNEMRVGVMADEVEKIKPEAVLTRNDGLKMVDYAQIGTAHGH